MRRWHMTKTERRRLYRKLRRRSGVFSAMEASRIPHGTRTANRLLKSMDWHVEENRVVPNGMLTQYAWNEWMREFMAPPLPIRSLA